ncbi:MAG: RNase P subunit p30 family protein [Candidatus Aenigmatarchaeota archaeon]
MDFYDLYVPAEDVDKAVEMGEKLGFSGIGIAMQYGGEEDIDGFIDEVDERNGKTDLDLVTCCDIDVESVDMLKRLVGKVRQKVEIVAVRGGDLDINKAAVRDSRVDILLHPEHRRKDRGLDHKIANSASKNDVALGVVLHPLLQTYGKLRSHIFKHIMDNLELCDKYNAPVVITSGARKGLEMRDPRELASLAECLGTESGSSIDMVSSVPRRIVNRNRKKLEGKVRKRGVEETD